MTLQQKFEQAPDVYNANFEVVKGYSTIADDFAIGLLEFIEGTYSYSNIFDYWYLHADTSKTYTKKQLLELYKKEKGL